HAGDAAWFQAERAAGEQVRQIVAQGLPESGFGHPAERLLALWGLDLLVLANALWVGALGVLGASLARTRWGRAGRALAPGLRWGVGAAVLVLAAVVSLTEAGVVTVELAFLSVAFLLAVSCACGLALRRHALLRGAAAATVAMVAFLVIACGAGWQARALYGQ